MEYVLRIDSLEVASSYTITLGTGFTNPWDVDLTTTAYANDQFVFLAIDGVLELQPEPVLNS